MKETVLSAKTSGTARKKFEVIVKVIKKIPPQIFFVFLRRAFFTFSELVRFSRSGSHISLNTIANLVPYKKRVAKK